MVYIQDIIWTSDLRNTSTHLPIMLDHGGHIDFTSLSFVLWKECLKLNPYT
jgi:hypothetical protein